MIETVSILIEAEWRRVEPSGATCCCCQEIAWMQPVELFALVNNSAQPTGVVLCQNCADTGEIEVEKP